MVSQEYEMIVKQMEQEKHHQMHANGEKHDCCDDDGNCSNDSMLSDEEKEELHAIAERRVKLGLVLSEIGTKNKIQVNQQDLQQAVMAEARKYPGQEAQVFEFYQKNQQALESLRAPMFEEKVVDYIVELADVTEKKVSIEELTKDDDGELESFQKKSKTKSKSSKAKKSDGDTKAETKKAAPKKKVAEKK
jgi:trigger factor